MDRIYGLPYTRRPHPSYTEAIPAFEMIKDSVTIMRGCLVVVRFVRSRPTKVVPSNRAARKSILNEIEQLAQSKTFKGTVSDIGGPTANMYQMKCTKPEVEAVCRRQSCVHPKICKCWASIISP